MKLRQTSRADQFYKNTGLELYEINLVVTAGLYTTYAGASYCWYDGTTNLGAMDVRNVKTVKSDTVLAADWADCVPSIGYGTLAGPFRGNHSGRGPVEGVNRLHADGSAHWRSSSDSEFKIRFARLGAGADDYYFW